MSPEILVGNSDPSLRSGVPKNNPKPGFYKLMSLAFLAIGVVLIWQAVVRHEWIFWAFAILTILNAIVAALKGLVAKETKP